MVNNKASNNLTKQENKNTLSPEVEENYSQTEGKKMTASDKAKTAGFKTLTEVSKITGVSTQTLNNWHNNKPLLFRVVIAGCKQIKGKINENKNN